MLPAKIGSIVLIAFTALHDKNFGYTGTFNFFFARYQSERLFCIDQIHVEFYGGILLCYLLFARTQSGGLRLVYDYLTFYSGHVGYR